MDLSKAKIINIPYGGNNLLKIINEDKVDFDILNKLLIDLLKNAIIPMNNLYFYHLDLKSQNLLYNDNKIKILFFRLTVILLEL